MPIAVNNSISKTCRKLLYWIVIVLVFEGLVRKIVPQSISMFIFFLKDIICIYALFIINQITLTGSTLKLFNIWKSYSYAFIPIIFTTAFHDPLLIFFGAKQYILYPVVAILVVVGFCNNNINELKKFIAFFSFLIIPTSAVAILQSYLPSTHWLNLSIDGGSLEDFSALDKLRVQSTFSFTAQYSFFLNCVSVFFCASLFIQPKYKNFTLAKLQQKILPISIGIALVIGVFITGGRYAVLGCAACIGVGTLYLLSRGITKFSAKIFTIFFLLLFALSALRLAKPEFFIVYDARSATDDNGFTQTDEVKSRFTENFLGWTRFLNEQDIWTNIMGNGIGVMSNGTEKFSAYAYNAKTKGGGFWTETDVQTVVWEGGIYMLLLYYGLRIYIILFAYKILIAFKNINLIAAGSFLMGIVVINGIFGSMAKQPPISLWFWLSIGCLLVLEQFDKESYIK